MASLVDNVNNTLLRRNGQLVTEAGTPPTPVSQLAGQSGLQAPPTTPGGVAALGGTAQQQAMAGSGAQKQSALRQSTDTSNTLAEAQADKRYRSTLTSGEQAEQDKRKRLGEVFGSTQERVQGLVNAEINKAATAQSAAQPAMSKPALATPSGLTVLPNLPARVNGMDTDQSNPQGNVDTTFNALMSALSGGKAANDPAVQNYINLLSGLTGQTPDQIAATASDAATKQFTTGVGGAAAAAISDPSKVNVTALMPQLGTNRDELSTLLGINPNQVDSMSIEDLNRAVQAAAGRSSVTTAAETQRQAGSAEVGAAERGAFREAGKEQATTGMAASEAQLGKLGESMQRADTVSFGGQNYTVEQLLSDENISKLVSDYVMAPPDSDVRKKLEGDPNAAGLLQFVHQYESTLKDAAGGIGKAATANTEIQTANKQLSTIAPNIAVPDALMSQLYGSALSKPQTAKLESTGVVKALHEQSPEYLQQNAGKINAALALGTQFPDVAPQLSKLDKDQLDKFINEPNASGRTPMQEVESNRRDEQYLGSIKGNAYALLDTYFGSVPDMATVLGDNQRRIAMGGAGDPNINVLDKDHDGRLDPGAVDTIYNKISASLSKADSPLEALGGATGWRPLGAPTGLTDAEKAKYNAGEGSYSAGTQGFAGAGIKDTGAPVLPAGGGAAGKGTGSVVPYGINSTADMTQAAVASAPGGNKATGAAKSVVNAVKSTLTSKKKFI